MRRAQISAFFIKTRVTIGPLRPAWGVGGSHTQRIIGYMTFYNNIEYNLKCMKNGIFTIIGAKIDQFRVFNRYPVLPSHEKTFFRPLLVGLHPGFAKYKDEIQPK